MYATQTLDQKEAQAMRYIELLLASSEVTFESAQAALDYIKEQLKRRQLKKALKEMLA